jgi:hypothetical protein
MRRLLFGSLAAATIVAIAGVAYAWQAGDYLNVPGPITGTYAGGIQGTFNFVPASAGEGIPSAPNGGACIIFRAKDLGFKKMWEKECTNDDDCSTPGENPYGYCHLPSQKCWSRPDPEKAPGSDDALCRRGNRLPSPVPINTDIDISVTPPGAYTPTTTSIPAPISTPSWGIRHNARARVVTRLNCATPACGPNGESFILKWGDDKQL